MKRIHVLAVLMAFLMLGACMGVAEEEIDHIARAESLFNRARNYFSEVSQAAEGTVQKSASAAASGAAQAASAAGGGNVESAVVGANRAKLDAVLAAAAIDAHKSIDGAVRKFDAQVAELESCAAEQRPEQLARVAERLSAVAKALRDAMNGD